MRLFCFIEIAFLALDQGSDIVQQPNQPVQWIVRVHRFRACRIALIALAVLLLDQGVDVAQQFGQPVS